MIFIKVLNFGRVPKKLDIVAPSRVEKNLVNISTPRVGSRHNILNKNLSICFNKKLFLAEVTDWKAL